MRLAGATRVWTGSRLVPCRPSLASRLARALFDRTFAVLALVFFLPVFVVVSLAILLRDGWPVFYVHRRIGKGGRTFPCLKFRTMSRDADRELARLLASDPEAAREWAETRKLRNDPRVSCIGRILRKTSLDELPQFLNVLAGHMSVVGPRPIVAEELERYGSHADAYLSVRPGITGLWQVSGRSDTSYARRVALDVEYVRTQSLRRDMAIILRTVWVMLAGRGAC